ncbi:hypothetical protein HDU83_007808 [Entophlyctis luteolus]|nr:hypothetical protein HDU83_007808 [Entophlyctis luteolus]
MNKSVNDHIARNAEHIKASLSKIKPSSQGIVFVDTNSTTTLATCTTVAQPAAENEKAKRGKGKAKAQSAAAEIKPCADSKGVMDEAMAELEMSLGKMELRKDRKPANKNPKPQAGTMEVSLQIPQDMAASDVVVAVSGKRFRLVEIAE